MPDPPRLYWDSCVFLSYVNGMADRVPHINALLAKSGKDFQILTSTLSIVEVAFGKAEQDGHALDEQVERELDRLWGDPAVQLVEFFPLIGYEARALIRQALPRGIAPLKPMDAIHVATARWLGVAEFHTYDDKILKYPVELGMRICPPLDATPELPLAYPPSN